MTLTNKYLQSDVWFSDIEETLEDLVDEIVLDEDIYTMISNVILETLRHLIWYF